MSERRFTGKGENVREKMIEVTARILREKGFRATTVRTIAREAGVNIAAIRYYFGSKEELIGCALEYMMSNLEGIIAYLDDNSLSPRDRLKKYILSYFDLARIHPALFRSISHPTNVDARDTYFIYLNLLHDQCWDKVVRNVAEITGYSDRRDLELRSMQLFAAMEYPIILASNSRGGSFITRYTDRETLERYTDILLDDVTTIRERNEYLKEIMKGAK